MATSRCPKCESGTFEATPLSVRGGNKPTAIQCANCGAIVGLLPDTGEVAKVIASSIQKTIADALKKTGK